jgi:hypothetical protein
LVAWAWRVEQSGQQNGGVGRNYRLGPESASANAPREVVELDRAEAMQLLASVRFGRLRHHGISFDGSAPPSERRDCKP